MSERYLELIKNYMRDQRLRSELNALAQRTFGINFESWVRDGYFEGQYIPYSYFQRGKIVANVSVNLMDFILFGEPRTYVQIGTVMTEEGHRKHGLAKSLIQFVIEDYKDKVDDIYLFGTDFAKEFYLKCGFKEGVQHQYYLKNWKGSSKRSFVKADSTEPMKQKIYLEYLRRMIANSAFAMDNYGLMTFWTAGMDEIYYSVTLGCYVSAAIREDTLYLNHIISAKNESVMDIIEQMGPGFSTVVLGFTPRQEEIPLFETRQYQEANCSFLYLGEQLKCIQDKKLFFPVYSHA